MTELITYIFEFVTLFISFWTFFTLFKQKKNSQVPLGNTFLALGAFFLGIYALFTIIYSLIGQEWAIITFLKLGMVSLMIGVLFLFYTMQILTYSSKSIKIKKISYWGSLVAFLVIALILLFTNYITVVDSATGATHFQSLQFYLFAIFVAFMLVYSTIPLYRFGIKKNTGETKKRAQFFLIALLFFIGSLFIDAIGNIIEIEALFDTLLFAFISIGILFATRAFYGKKSDH